MLANLLFGLLILGTVRYGDYITDECPQQGYACPAMCDVDHKHLPLEECKNGKETKNKSRTNPTPIYEGEPSLEDTVADR